MKFIKLTDFYEGGIVHINVAHIIYVYEDVDVCGNRFSKVITPMSNSTYSEPVDEIMKMIMD